METKNVHIQTHQVQEHFRNVIKGIVHKEENDKRSEGSPCDISIATTAGRTLKGSTLPGALCTRHLRAAEVCGTGGAELEVVGEVAVWDSSGAVVGPKDHKVSCAHSHSDSPETYGESVENAPCSDTMEVSNDVVGVGRVRPTSSIQKAEIDQKQKKASR